jgi:hypothetical protein
MPPRPRDCEDVKGEVALSLKKVEHGNRLVVQFDDHQGVNMINAVNRV